MKKYKLEGLDCAQCAANIESALNQQEGLSTARINFATKTLALDSGMEDLARSVIGEVDPNVSLVAGHQDELRAQRRQAWAIARIVAASLLFVGGLLLRPSALAVSSAALVAAYVAVGYPVLLLAGRNILKGKIFDEMFLMAVATIGAFLLGEIPEAVGVMLFYSIGEYFQDMAVQKSRRSIEGLVDMRPDFARVKGLEGYKIVAPGDLAVGDVVEVRPGEKVPADGVVVEGDSFLDTSSLTGEPVPRRVAGGDAAMAACVNSGGVRLLLRVTAPYSQSAAARILELVEDAAGNKAPVERYITKIAAWYTPAVVIGAAALAFLPPLVIPGAGFAEWARRALVLLVISCPCALVISIPLGFFGGIGAASRGKVLMKGANYLDGLLSVKTVVFDKTGTLTEGKFEVREVSPNGGFRAEEIVKLAASAELYSSHPIAAAIRRAAQSSGDGNSQPEHVVETKGKGVEALVDGRKVQVGTLRFLQERGVQVDESLAAMSAPSAAGASGVAIYVAVADRFAGVIQVADRIRNDAAHTIRELRELGVERFVMLTGDAAEAARMTAGSTGVDEWRAELLPEDKVKAVEELERSLPPKGKLLFVGDGMNDAPSLMRADIGVAMGGVGSDAAIEAADAVVMDDDIARLPKAFRIARGTRRIVTQNIVFALAFKTVFLALGAFGAATMWEAVIADVGVALVAVLNSVRAVRLGIDKKGDI